MSPPRRGYTILEATIALGVLAVALVAVAQSVVLAAQQRRVTQRRQLARQAADNALERLFALPWKDLTPETAATTKLLAGVEDYLPGATLTVAVEEVAGPPQAKRVRVEVGWNDAAGAVASPVSLTAWRYKI